MIKRLYNWTMDLANHPQAYWCMFWISFIESSIFPIPPDVLLIPMVLSRPDKYLRIATLCAVGGVLGGILGYGIGYFGYEHIGKPILSFYGHPDGIDTFKRLFDEWGIWFVAAAGFTPFPFKIVTIASGVVHMDFTTFVITSSLARPIRFFIVAFLLHRYGPSIRHYMDKHLTWIATLFFLLLLGGFLGVKYLF